MPAEAILGLLDERPRAPGASVPGMPTRPPGTEAPGAPVDTYDVILFGPAGQRSFVHYRGG